MGIVGFFRRHQIHPGTAATDTAGGRGPARSSLQCPGDVRIVFQAVPLWIERGLVFCWQALVCEPGQLRMAWAGLDDRRRGGADHRGDGRTWMVW